MSNETLLQAVESDDIKEYMKYLLVLGKENLPNTIEKWIYLKYTNDNEYKLIKYNYKLRNKVINNPKNVISKIIVAKEKYDRYLFNKNNKKGLIKGELITKVLGYDKFNYMEFDKKIKDNIKYFPKRYKGKDKYGEIYEVNMVLKGLKNRFAKITIGVRYINNKYILSSIYINRLKESELNNDNQGIR